MNFPEVVTISDNYCTDLASFEKAKKRRPWRRLRCPGLLFLILVLSIVRPERQRSRNEEYPFGLLRFAASGSSGGAADGHYGNKETQNKIAGMHAV